MIREEVLNDQKILDTLKNNPLGRNQQLDTFIGLLNSINKNAILSIDGEWGSGKTFFVKQLEYLNKVSIPHIDTLGTENIKLFRENYQVYYFNAWENDYHDDPLESLLFSLINDIWERKDLAADSFAKFSKGLINSSLKTITAGFYDSSEFDKIVSIADLAKRVKTASDRRRAIDDILNNYLDITGKRLIFVIDELDRCKPTYAVKLLEVIKHYYTNDRTVFLLSTNNVQLSHTIRKVYGQSFDGPSYLNKFYDLIFNLPDFDVETYIKYIGVKIKNGHFKDEVPMEVARYLGLSLRQVNRYYSSLSLIEAYLDSEGGFDGRTVAASIVKYVLIPLAYGLRISSSSDYSDFVKGKALELVVGFATESEIVRDIITRDEDASAKEDPSGYLRDIYIKVVTKERPKNQNDYKLYRNIEVYHRVVLLMNASGPIDEIGSIEPESKRL